MKKVAIVFGTRPEAIKLAPLVMAFRKEPSVQCRVCVTGQHRQMLDQVLRTFELTPDADLALMQPDQTLPKLTARAIEALDGFLAAEKPALVLGQGDTTTVLCAALAAFYRHIPFGHVEAGLRTGNLEAPWPEEGNRAMVSRLSALHFAPTEGAKANLLREGLPESAIFVTGNTVIDALLLALEKVKAQPPGIPGLSREKLAAWGNAPLVLITGHRRENFGEGFARICRAVARLARHFPQVQFVYPVHLNPNVREPVGELLAPASLKNVHLIEPLAYLPFVALMHRATLILTDSGGVQEEAPSLGKPVLVMRETTERPEAVAAGTVRLVGTDEERIVESVSGLLTDPASYEKMARAQNPYGDGRACERIVAACLKFLAR